VKVSHIPELNLKLLRNNGADSRDLMIATKRRLGEVIKARELQIVHGHNLHHFNAAPAIAINELRQELGFQLHHTFHETWPDVLHEYPVYQQWDGNYAVSRFVQDECARRIGFRPQLWPLGIDTQRFNSMRMPMADREVFTILHPARILPWKGVHVSVDMLAQLKQRGITARLIITDTQRIIDWDEELISYRKQIFKRLRSQGLEDLVELRQVSYKDIHLLYEEADIVVYPTVGEEPYGLVPLEAMSMARPVVGSRSGGIIETIVDGKTGFLVERGESVLLADKVERLLMDPTLSQRMGRAGRQHVVTNFNGHKYASQLFQHYLSSG
jgi:glycosyltransferase involved in cell wall biosynthesis